MFYFIPRWGFFSPFCHDTTSLSVTQEYLALQGGPCWFTRDSTCPMLLGLEHKPMMLLATGLLPSRVQDSTTSPSSTVLILCSPTTPFSWFRLLPFRSPLLRELLLLSIPLATKMFQFTKLSLACPWIQQQLKRLSYSGMSRSMLIFNSMKHFVAYHALPCLSVPRYPP